MGWWECPYVCRGQIDAVTAWVRARTLTACPVAARWRPTGLRERRSMSVIRAWCRTPFGCRAQREPSAG